MTQDHKKTKKIALIDGYGFVFRAFHALPPLTRDDGTPVGAVYGFTNMLIKLLANLEVSHIAMVFDSGAKTFRNDLYPEYKANRPPCPEDLIPQFPIIREVAEALNITILEKVGFEADDLIATVAKQASREDFEVIIVSSDKDLMQLIDDKIIMYDALKNRMITPREVEEKFSVKPSQVLDVLALMGDASDNVPGVRGIGPKTAAELINKYQTLEILFKNLHEIKQEKRRQTLEGGIQSAKLSKQLIKLCETVPVSNNMQDYLLRHIDGEKLVNFLEKQGFRALVSRVKKDFKVEDVVESKAKNNDLFSSDSSNSRSGFATPTLGFESNLKQDTKQKVGVANPDLRSNIADSVMENYDAKKTIVTDISSIKNITKNAVENGNLVIDFVFKDEQPENIILSTISDSNLLKEIFFTQIIAEKSDDNEDLFTIKKDKDEDKKGLKLEEVLTDLMPVLFDDSINKIGYNVKELVKYLTKINKISGQNNNFNFHDIAIMGYVLNSSENKTNLDVLVANNLPDDVTNNDFSSNCQEIAKGKIPASFANFDKKVEFYCFKNYALWQLYKILKAQIFSEKLNNVYYCFEKPLIKVLASIEANGIAVDEIKLKELSAYFDIEIKKLTKEIYDLAGQEFNIGSPKQMAQILFEKLSLKTGQKSKKTGAFSTNSEVLEELDLEGHIIAGKILQWRGFSKLKSTYADALQNAINLKTKRIHTTLSNISTSTGRLSSNNPNLQNIPIRTKEGRKIRSAFIAPKNCKLISADYSQIELRVLSSISNIDALKQAFLEDKDIHAITAAQVFGAKEKEIDKEMRRRAKAINFGIIYGISAFGLAKQLRISRYDAAKYIENYFITYPGIKRYMSHYQDLARQNGYVETIAGRKCFIPNINSKNPILRGLAERLSINAPIQGSAADIIKKAMIDFDRVLFEQKLKSKIILQVHDELLVEAPEGEVEKVSALLKSTMEKAILLDIPLKVDVKIEDRWQ
jgi:DNA polymerase-1